MTPATEDEIEEAVDRLRELGAHTPGREHHIRTAGSRGWPRDTLREMARFYRYMAGRTGELPEVPPRASGEPVE